MNELEKEYTLLHGEVRILSQSMNIIMSRLDKLLPVLIKTDNNTKQSADSGDPKIVLPIESMMIAHKVKYCEEGV